ncbi:MAG TPA: hypothetical protein VIC54_11410 [Terriglobales bacterium]|jgi:hypothetical protein
MDDLTYLAGLGEDPADLQSDLHPYLRLLIGAGPRVATPRDPLGARPGRGPLEPQPSRARASLFAGGGPPPGKTSGGYLELAQRRLRTRRLTPGGLPQAPEVMGVDADARVPNVLQPMSGEMTAAGEIAGGVPAFHNPTEPPPTGVASQETAAPGLLQQGRTSTPDAAALAILKLAGIAPVGNERGMDATPRRSRRG